MKILVAIACVFVLVLVSIGGWIAWKRSRYPETILADGTRIQFLGYTYREAHTNYVGSPWKERIRSKLPPKLKPMLGSGFLSARSPISPEHPVAWLLLTRPPGGPAVFGNPLIGAGARIEVADSHGCVFVAKEWHFPGGATDGQHWLMHKPMPVYPRREPVITMRFVDRSGGLSAMSIPNPEYRKYPEWKPERTLQTTNQFTVEFLGWRSGGAPAISVRDGDGSPTALAPRNLRIADATGNSNATSLCLYEAAIQIQDEMLVRPLKPGDMLQLRSLHIPPSNHVEYKQQRLRAGTNEVAFIALTGKGKYSVSFDGFLDHGTAAHPLLFLEFAPGTRREDYVVWVNNRRTPVTRTGMTAAGKPVYGYLLDVPTTVVNVEVGLEPCMPVDLLVPMLPPGRSL